MGLPYTISVLLYPLSKFDQLRINLPIALGIVLLVAAVHAGSLFVTAGIFADTVGGTTMVENEDRPSDHFCSNSWPFDKPAGCNEPKLVPLDLGDYAGNVIGDTALPAGFAVLLAWPLLAWLVHLLSINASDNQYSETLTATAWTFVPLLLPALARPIVFKAIASTYIYPDTLDALALTVKSLTIGFGSLPFTAICLVALCWQGYVLLGVSRGIREVSIRRAIAIVAVSLGLFLMGAIVHKPVHSGSGLALAGVLLVLFGLFSATFARSLIMLNTRVELMGMRGGENVEPTNWYLGLHKIGGVVAATVGMFLYGGYPYVI